jgi:hypothetical protein
VVHGIVLEEKELLFSWYRIGGEGIVDLVVMRSVHRNIPIYAEV